MRNGSPSPKNRVEEIDPQRVAMLNLIKKYLRIDLLEKLQQMQVDLDEPSTQWLNLSCYDQKDQNSIPLHKENEEVWARCLMKMGEKTNCVRGVVLAWVE